MGKTGKICYGCCSPMLMLFLPNTFGTVRNIIKKTKNVIWGFIQYLKLLYGKRNVYFSKHSVMTSKKIFFRLSFFSAIFLIFFTVCFGMGCKKFQQIFPRQENKVLKKRNVINREQKNVFFFCKKVTGDVLETATHFFGYFYKTC